uniref:glutathione transferase n=1 Tax=Naja naja TaxID=35670 RepID=A0A8C6VJV5_NAJNA
EPLQLFFYNHSGIRLLLEYTGTSYEDKLYSCGEAPDYDKSKWMSEKEKLGLDFPNLPYLIDGKTKLTQSNAILRYIARKHHLCGETEEELIRVDMLENQVMDFRMALVMICYNPDFIQLLTDLIYANPFLIPIFTISFHSFSPFSTFYNLISIIPFLFRFNYISFSSFQYLSNQYFYTFICLQFYTIL